MFPRPPPIGILIPVYNGARHLQECIESALEQKGVEKEIWISDDGSTDDSRAIMERFQRPGVHILTSKKNQGLFANLNHLIMASRNPFFQILCQDDILEPECVSTVLKQFSRSARAGIMFSKSTSIDLNSKVMGKARLYDLPNILRPELALQHFFFHGCIPSNLSTVALRRSALIDVGLFDEGFKVSGDYELWTRICRTYEMGIVHDHLVRIRSHKGQLSAASQSGPSFVAENRRIRHELVAELPVSVQKQVPKFEVGRYGVLDFHYAFRSILQGRLGNARRVFSTMGPRHTLLCGLNWLFSINNRVLRPQAEFVLPRNYRVGPGISLQQ